MVGEFKSGLCENVKMAGWAKFGIDIGYWEEMGFYTFSIPKE